MKLFEMPEIEILALETVDVITTSPVDPEWSTDTGLVWH